MDTSQLAEQIAVEMGLTPTGQQRALIDALARFCGDGTAYNSVFLLNGYAGTGKTSVVAALVKALRALRRPTVLLAPTGRAAKVLSGFADKKAMTIHRKIYKGLGDVAAVAGVADNPHVNAIFIVDEASMIGDGEQDSLLEDLVHYVYGSGHDCRMILLGDGAQLPPVGCEASPAMLPERLRKLGLRVTRAVMTQTVRQKARSGILYNATMLRRAMAQEQLPVPQLRIRPFADVRAIGGEELQDALVDSYAQYGVDETILVTRSNKRAMEFNLAIRRSILEKEEVITQGEPLLIAKNNYFWTAKVKGADFVANGDVVRVNKIYGTEIIGFLRFADVELSLPDSDITFDAKLILNSLNSVTAGLNPEHEQMLMARALAGLDPATAADPTVRRRIFHTDPYFNALRVKYAYAVTCHKAQGGQWESVFIDMANISNDAVTTLDFYRWLYTATTRARTAVTYISPTITED
ncbi:MAG: AAA family ATPase [Barnesiella sp.]|nr:AAA family ATPase [Barnesiella sp.]